ncbi:AP2 domain-containing protein [Xanthomonas sacchari]|uniref:AP2 domain-containing protein n=1 Tax=Xanthomonas sacchari TaxID=56458 RepID=A0AA46PQ88_9XANT|nr:AP2 domain-containing protein [Xanthomonas sacchari]UYK87087.1 AP2 domain-containing protein [Xanthomonas sacchari]
MAIGRRGERFHQEFRVATYGDADKTKAAAISYRDEVLKKIPAMSRSEFGTIVRSNNKSGVPGVFRREENGFARWCAMVSLPDGKTRRRTFGVVKYGEENARQKAVEARLELLKLLDGWFVHHPDAMPPGPAPTAVVEPTMPKREKTQAGKTWRQPSPEKRVYRTQIKWSLRSGAQVCRDYWVAECTLATGGTRRKQFSVTEYGEDDARRRAFEQRGAWLAQPPEPARRRAQRPRAGADSAKPQPGI